MTPPDPPVPILVLSLKTPERMAIFERNRRLVPQLELVKSVNGYDVEGTIDAFRSLGIRFHSLCEKFQTYGTLANFVTKVQVLHSQIARRLPHLCFIEDDVVLREGFVDFVNAQADELVGDVNMVRLGNWGEGYITSLDGASRIWQHIQADGVVDSIDNQLRLRCGKEVRSPKTPWKLVVPTNAGDCTKTSPIDAKGLERLRSLRQG